MDTLQDGVKPEVRKAHVWLPNSISAFALVIAGISLFISWRQWQENRHNAQIMAAPLVSVVENSDTDDPLVGLQISNDGAAGAKLKDITFYVDRKPMADVDAVLEAGKLEDVGYFDFGDEGVLAVGEKQWLLSKKSKDKEKDVASFNDFMDKHVAVEVTACSIVTGQCETKCSEVGWCK